VYEDVEIIFEWPYNNDLWLCLDDGCDVDMGSDGCLCIGIFNDLMVEWIGGFFDLIGKYFYVSV